ncbi:OLC1v1031915C1 [Oldenlandia corymbosa var. corymbosa]|uniref:OLC1v1031915C1 n=1 Tax=Oldenlandia corymbosa var. corymbosa TaxID=529605 RepID=A0AAV1CKI9_OLDCO|nr:OLC1v1031915C1 [Oldenlandia corymbosa var. corymbosa]
MGSKSIKFLAFLLLLNLVFFSLVSACDECPKPKPKPKKPKCPKPSPKPKSPKTKSPKPASPPPPPPPESPKATCPITLDLNPCLGLLNLAGIINIGLFSEAQCCPLLDDLADPDAAACLCNAVKVKVPGIINLILPVNINPIFERCHRTCPEKFQYCSY